ncbi:hypothetical protein K0B04_03630 [Patescibacteria group bacterium]|nr:hypothetical protein [Patescibacteria group bacterium]
MKKHLPIIIPVVTVLILSIFVSTKIFKPGYIYFRDVTEGIEVSDLYKRYIFTFSDDIGESLAEKSRIPIFYSVFGTYSVGRLVGFFNDSDYVKVKILSLFISSISIFIFTTYQILKEITENQGGQQKNSAVLSLAASLGGVYYVSNFWFSNRIAHFGLFYSTVTIPVTFFLLYKYLFTISSDYKKLILLLISTALLTGTPHTVLFQIIIFFSLYMAFIINKNFNKELKIKKTVQLLIFGLFYFPLNAYWIMPFLSSMSQPDAVLTETIVNAIGKNAYLSNVIRLTGYWLNSYQDYFIGISQEIGNTLAVFPLLIALTALIFIVRKGGLFVSLFIILVLGIFLSISSDITNLFYFRLMFNSPIKNFGWLFREYDKMGILLTYVYSFGIAVFLAKGSKKTPLFFGSILLVSIILALNISFLGATLVKNYTPQPVPDDFSKVILFLKQDKENFHTAWYPGIPQPTWAKEPEVRFWFANLISTDKSSITTSSTIMNLINYLFSEENIYSINIGKSLDKLGVKYLMIRKDYPYYFENDYENKLLVQKSLEKVYETNNVTVYKNLEFSGTVNFYQDKVLTNQGLDAFKNIHDIKSDSLLVFSDKGTNFQVPGNTSYIPNAPTLDYAISRYKENFIYPFDYSAIKYDGSSGAWKIGSLENINHAETDFFFGNLGIKIPQFDYERGVIIAKEGFEKVENYTHAPMEFLLSFEEEEYASYDGKNLTFEVPTTPFDGPWNATKSSFFEVGKAEAIEVSLNSYIPNELEAHFKLSYFNQEGKNIKTLFMYPDRSNKVNSILEVSENTYFAEFSVWSRNIFGPNEPLHVRNIKVSDVTEISTPVSMKIKASNDCLSNCTVFIRLLISRVGGEVELNVANRKFNISTLKEYELEHSERYEWVKVGEIEELGKSVDIKIANTNGFNSVNCLAILDRNEVRDMEMEMQRISSSFESFTINTDKPNIEVEKINPTKYEVNVSNATGNRGILVFSKPFSKNWVIQNQEASNANGYANGWEIEKLENSTYIIEYKPQKFFHYGIVVSCCTLLALAMFFHYSKTRDVMASELKSKSQG